MFIDLKTTPKFIEREDVSDKYLNDIKNYRILTQHEEKLLLEEYRNGNIEARNRIIQANQRFIFAIARRYANNSTELMDLVNEGNIGFIKALDTYDIERGVKLLVHAIYYITREINNFLSTNNNLIRKSNNIKYRKKIKKIKNEFFALNGRYPNEEEIKEIMETKYNLQINDVRDIYELSINSINDNLSDGSDVFTFEESELFNQKSSSTNEYLKEENTQYNSNIINELLNTLNDREKTIVKMYFGINYEDSFTIEQISDLLNITKERIRQIKDDAISKMQKMMVIQGTLL